MTNVWATLLFELKDERFFRNRCNPSLYSENAVRIGVQPSRDRSPAPGMAYRSMGSIVRYTHFSSSLSARGLRGRRRDTASALDQDRAHAVRLRPGAGLPSPLFPVLVYWPTHLALLRMFPVGQ